MKLNPIQLSELFKKQVHTYILVLLRILGYTSALLLTQRLVPQLWNQRALNQFKSQKVLKRLPGLTNVLHKNMSSF